MERKQIKEISEYTLREIESQISLWKIYKSTLNLRNLRLHEGYPITIPEDVKSIDLSGNSYLPKLPTELEVLYMNDTFIEELTSFPPNLKELYIGHNYIKRIENLPDSLEVLHIPGSYSITKLPPLPSNLKKLVLNFSHHVEELPDLPKNLEELVVQDVPLKVLPHLPKTLTKLNIWSTGVTELSYLPDTLEALNIMNTKISFIPNRPKNIKSLLCYDCSSLQVQISNKDSIQSYFKKWIPIWEEEQKKKAIAACKSVKEDLMIATWHPKRVDWWMDEEEKNEWLQFGPLLPV